MINERVREMDMNAIENQWLLSKSKPLNHNEPIELESDNEAAEVEIDLQLSRQEKLTRAIDKEMNSKMELIKMPVWY
jgi:hypothetical protein